FLFITLILSLFMIISLGFLGIESPPNTSGHTGTALPSATNLFPLSSVLSLPSYLHLIPAKPALTMYNTTPPLQLKKVRNENVRTRTIPLSHFFSVYN